MDQKNCLPERNILSIEELHLLYMNPHPEILFKGAADIFAKEPNTPPETVPVTKSTNIIK